jgi:hypothetical protein
LGRPEQPQERAPAHRRAVGGSLPSAGFPAQPKGDIAQATPESLTPPRPGGHQIRHPFTEHLLGTPADETPEAPHLQMDDDPTATTREIRDRPLIATVSPPRATAAARTAGPLAGRPRRHMQRLALQPHLVNPDIANP